jgi:glycosyltransferase involved in cell wall biosynthesis
MKLSLLIVGKKIDDEVKTAIASAADVCDDIWFVSTLSKAVVNDPRINSEYFKFEQDFSAVRNFAISKAEGDWFLFLDSDEVLSDELKKELQNLLKDPMVDGYWLSRKTFISKDRYLKHGLFYPDFQLRLFRNHKQYRYHGAVHEQLDIPAGKTKKVYLDLLHYPSNPKYTKYSDFKNVLPYMEIEANDIRIKKLNSFYLIGMGIGTFFSLFFGGFFRGKGFLDGFAGLRAHIIFALSIAIPYIMTAKWQLTGKKTV